MKTRIFAMLLVLALTLSMLPMTFAASTADATIDISKPVSLTIYKYDFTNAVKDGIWDSSYVSTGTYDAHVTDTLGGSVRLGDTDTTTDLGNGSASRSYAIAGVEFTALRVADIRTYSETENGASHVEVLYGFPTAEAERTDSFLASVGLSKADRYAPADTAGFCYYRSDVLINALSAALKKNATTVKNALETYVKNAANKLVFAETDANGKTSMENMDQGLYLVVETRLPEQVTDTTAPFLISAPMTSVDGGGDGNLTGDYAYTTGGHEWNYNPVIYPKNLTGIPSLEKTVRESKNDTGSNNGSASDITDGFAHTATGSTHDVMEYQIVSTLPSITSEATYLSCYTFFDSLAEGLTYNRDVQVQIFTDPDCTDLVETLVSGTDYTVTYNHPTADTSAANLDLSAPSNEMTIEMTAKGLAKLNTSKLGRTSSDEDGSCVNSGYSDYTMRITYSAAVDSDASVIYGDAGNSNEVVLTWSRSNSDYYDTLIDDAHVYTYGLELTKQFSDGGTAWDHVKFTVQNTTDRYWIKAELNAEEGVYYVTGHVAAEAEATQFIPMEKGAPNEGKVIVMGLEPDAYCLTEIETANGYTLLKDAITVEISTELVSECGIYAGDALGVIQNDPRYAEGGEFDYVAIQIAGNLHQKTMPQKYLVHQLVKASAAVDGNAVSMLAMNRSELESADAVAPLTVVNTRGFDLPVTGDRGVWMYAVGGIAGMSAAAFLLALTLRKRKNAQ